MALQKQDQRSKNHDNYAFQRAESVCKGLIWEGPELNPYQGTASCHPVNGIISEEFRAEINPRLVIAL